MPRDKSQILFAPHEIAGQMRMLAKGFSQAGMKTGLVARDRRSWRDLADFWPILFKNSVFYFFYGRSLLPRLVDLPILRLCRKKVCVHFRGSDIRCSSQNNYSRDRFLGLDYPRPPLQRPHQRKALETWRRYADHIFVSTPDLLQIVPEATVVPQCIDLNEWAPTRPRPNTENVRVVHAPSSGRKGTEFVVAAVNSLRDAGHNVELKIAQKLPRAEVKQLFQTADIGIDQLYEGWYGNVSVELMACGKPTLAYISPELNDYDPDLPIVRVTPATLARELESLIVDPQRRQSIGERSREYVEQVHALPEIVSKVTTIWAGEEKPDGPTTPNSAE